MASRKDGLLTSRTKHNLLYTGIGIALVIIMLITFVTGWLFTSWWFIGIVLVLAQYFYSIPFFNKKYFEFLDMEPNSADIWLPIYNEITTAPRVLKILDIICIIVAVVTYLLSHVSITFYASIFSKMTAVHIASLMTALPIIFIALYLCLSGVTYIVALLKIRTALDETINRNTVSNERGRRWFKKILEQSIFLFSIFAIIPFIRIFALDSLQDKLELLLDKDVHYVYKEDEIERMKLPPHERGLNSYEIFRDRYDVEDDYSDSYNGRYGNSSVISGRDLDDDNNWDDRW